MNKTEPTVACIMLTRDRPEYAARAVECFRRQTYKNKRLLIWDTGELNRDFDDQNQIAHIPAQAYREPSLTIGALRNEGIAFWSAYPIIIHWDDDDWSHPSRISEQVALLQASGADAVGYSEMLFWRHCGEAWIFRYLSPRAIGTSLCYWRKTWERKPFPDLPKPPELASEDVVWQRNLKVEVVSSLWYGTTKLVWGESRMIARIHGSNSMPYDIEGDIERGSQEWRRAPRWDKYCAEVMEYR